MFSAYILVARRDLLKILDTDNQETLISRLVLGIVNPIDTHIFLL